MVAFDLNSGVRLWESNIGGIQTPWVVSRFIFVLSKDNELICLSSKDGKVVWVSKLKDFMDFEKKMCQKILILTCQIRHSSAV